MLSEPYYCLQDSAAFELIAIGFAFALLLSFLPSSCAKVLCSWDGLVAVLCASPYAWAQFSATV